MVICYEPHEDRICKLNQATNRRRKIISKRRHLPIRLSIKECNTLPFVRTRRVYTPAMKTNLLLVAYGSLTDFSQRTSKICDIARIINMPPTTVSSLLLRFNNLGHDIERFLQY